MAVTAYCDPQALIDEFGEAELIQLTDVGVPPTGAVDTDVAQQACNRANVEIAAALAARYPNPLPSVPERLRYLARDLAHYYLYRTDPPTWIADRHKAALAALRDIRSGAESLGIDGTGADVDPPPTGLPEFEPGDKAFGRSDAW